MNPAAQATARVAAIRTLPTTPQSDRVTRLKHQIALGRYRVDPDVVAGEILFTLQLLRLTRRALLAGRGGSGQERPSPHA